MGIFDMLMGGGSFGGFGGGFGGSSHRAPSVFPHHDPLGDAVNEVVTETIKDVLNPERKERRRQTERCNDEAQEALDEANELRSHDIARLQAKTEDLGQQLQQQAETLAELKKRIGRSVEQEITPQIHRFQAFDIQQRVGCAPDMASASSSPALPSFGSMTSSVIGGFGGLGGGLSLLGLLHDDTQGDLDIAQENRYKAREYLAKVRKAVAEMKTQADAIAATLASMQSEEQTLRELYRRLQRHMAALSEAQRQKTFTQEEADAWQTICDISVLIRDSLRVQICKSDGSTAAAYDRYLAQLERILAEVPEQPSMHHPLHLRIPLVYY